MEIFKKTVLKRHKQDENLLKGRWENLQKYKSKIDFIRNIKEEKYQDGFLRDVFENCLGYVLDTTNPEHFNIRREEKNETDNKKADAVILVDDKVIGIIELKDQKTKNLDSVEIQAFNYHNSHSNSKYIIISNFDEVRFYIDKKTKFESFSLFNLDFESFKLLHLVLSFESISINLPIKLLDETNEFEKEISNLFYKDFAELRLQLFSDISNLNQIEKLEALAISQKILDRFIFIFFAEDRYLLNPKISDEIFKKWKNDIEFRSLFYFIKVLFNAVNSGNVRMDIPAYNGGLFANDHKIDNLEISDSVLEKIIQLSKYDFSSDIDVNILGHIFENSLDDLEKIRENIFGGEFDISRAKRKKDGIFYTPNYITEYIVRETVGKFCDEKKVELGFMNFDEIKSLETAKSYLNFLESLKIIDPAVGSGAFLNQAFNYLFDEYKSVYETIHKFAISGQNLFLTQDFDITIIENNLFGIDINQEAVEIAKLSLWLKTAKRGRKLTNLNRNIICADSLLNMPFKFGSFDIVIGNPPYGINTEKVKHNFELQSGESTILFMQLAIKLLKKGGFNGFIIPKPFIFASTWNEIRNKLKDEIKIIVDCGEVWSEVQLEQIIYVIQSNKKFEKYNNFILKDGKFIYLAEINKDLIDQFEFFINRVSEKEIFIALKMVKNSINLLEISFANWGDTFFKLIQEIGAIKVLSGANIQKYYFDGIKGFILEDVKVSKNAFIRDNSVLLQRIIAHIQNPIDHIKITGTIIKDITEYFIVNTIQQITLNKNYSNRYILALLHSNLINWFVYRFIFAKAIRTFQFSNDVIKRIPIVAISETEQQPFIERVDKLLELNKNLQKNRTQFLDELKLEKISQKLENFEKLSLDEFIVEFAKAHKIKLSDKLAERNLKIEWKSIFENDKSLIIKISSEIKKLETEIDNLVYKLYDLNSAEIMIIEGR